MTEDAYQIYLLAKGIMNPDEHASLANEVLHYLIDVGGYDLLEIKESVFWEDEEFKQALIDFSDGEFEEEDDGLDPWGDEIDPYADPDEEDEDY